MMTSSLGDVSLCWREILLTEWKHYCAKLLSSTHLFLFSEGKKNLLLWMFLPFVQFFVSMIPCCFNNVEAQALEMTGSVSLLLHWQCLGSDSGQKHLQVLCQVFIGFFSIS